LPLTTEKEGLPDHPGETAIEAGERLGFLPGTMYDKVNPYLRPLHDALYDMLDMDRAARLVERASWK